MNPITSIKNLPYARYELEQGSEDWHDLRRGRVGGSEAFSLVSSDKVIQALALEKAGDIIEGDNGKPSFDNWAMQRGRVLEPVALEEYVSLTFSNCEPVGYISKGQYLGVSPDAISWDDKKGVEIKCPLAKEWLRVCKFEGKHDKKYLCQIAWLMYLTRHTAHPVTSVDLVYFHPDLGLKIFAFDENHDEMDELFTSFDKGVKLYLEYMNQIFY